MRLNTKRWVSNFTQLPLIFLSDGQGGQGALNVDNTGDNNATNAEWSNKWNYLKGQDGKGSDGTYMGRFKCDNDIPTKTSEKNGVKKETVCIAETPATSKIEEASAR